ncbi:MAG: magnesium transporter CorA family protein [Streptosporangiaceae bacterium]
MNNHLISTDGAAATPDRPTVERLLKDDTLLWLDLDAANADGMALLSDVFQLHPLALESVREFGQRPKLQAFGDVSYIVSYGAQGMGEALVEVHCFYSEHYVITVRRDPCEVLEQLSKSIGQPDGALSRQPGSRGRPVRLILLHHVLDGLIDSFFPALSDFDDKIDDLQQQIFVKPTEDQLSQLFEMQKWLVGLRKLVTPQRDGMSSLVSGVTSLPGMTAAGEPYLRDLYDHLIRVSDLVDSYRDLLSNAMDAYLSIVSNRLNQVMKQLTVIATIFLPLSFLTGFFGQNFGWMVNRLGALSTFLLLGIGTELLAAAGLMVLFRKRGWF